MVGKEVTFAVDHKAEKTGREYGSLWVNKGQVLHISVFLVWQKIKVVTKWWPYFCTEISPNVHHNLVV